MINEWNILEQTDTFRFLLFAFSSRLLVRSTEYKQSGGFKKSMQGCATVLMYDSYQ